MAYSPRGIDYLREKLKLKRPKVLTRYKYYDMKNATFDFNISTPPELRSWNSCVGWCAKGVDTLADRLQFVGMRNDQYAINEIFDLNNKDIFTDSSILSALISSCCFCYISADDEGFPRLQIIDGGNATGILDPITYLLNEGYAVLERDDRNEPVLEAYFIAGETLYYRDGKLIQRIKNAAPYPLLVPVINRPDASREFGRSQISNSCMNLVGSALRTIKRSEVAAEFYSFPQKYATGVSDDLEMDKWRATMSSLLTFTKDSEGDTPKVGQFQQQDMTPHLEQIKMFAALFAGEVDLTLSDLLPIETASSEDEIEASHENLRLKATKAQRIFGTGFLNIGYLAACLRDDHDYRREIVYKTTPIWKPVFAPSASKIAGIGDAVYKLSQSYPDYFTEDKIFDMVGI